MMRFSIALALVLMTGCKVRNELSCEIPGNCVDAGGDAPMACDDSSDCTGANAMFCLEAESVCVQCLDDDNCSGSTPVCNATHQCEGCTAHSQCDSAACDFASGSCFPSESIAYVKADGEGTECTQTDPCGTLAIALETPHPVVKFDGTDPVIVNETQEITRDVTILAEVGAVLRRDSTGPVVTLSGASGAIEVEIQDLEISDGLGAAGDGILVADLAVKLTLDRVFLLANTGHGLRAGNGGHVIVRRSVVSGNNRGGINLADAKFEITNTLIVANGGGASTTGGFRAAQTLADSSFHFNTVANNTADTTTTNAGEAGVACALSPFDATSNIISGNQAGATCTFANSMFDAAAPIGNFNGTPDFLEITPANARERDYFRIGAASMAIDAANPTDEEIDVDGDRRPQGDAPDVGADERAP